MPLTPLNAMFRPLDQLHAGSLYILTGLAGAGKSHLATSARPRGTLWLIDTEGAAVSLRGKHGLHHPLEVAQTLSLRALLAALAEVEQHGQAGDAVVLDSLSKVFQAMRAYAQRQAGADTHGRTDLGVEVYASINRNMQLIYTGLAGLKTAGFHIILIGHLARALHVHENDTCDEDLRVLADAQLGYEADAILLLERSGDTRSLTPIIKPPRPAHLTLGTRYPSAIDTLYPASHPIDGHSIRQASRNRATVATRPRAQRAALTDEDVPDGLTEEDVADGFVVPFP